MRTLGGPVLSLMLVLSSASAFAEDGDVPATNEDPEAAQPAAVVEAAKQEPVKDPLKLQDVWNAWKNADAANNASEAEITRKRLVQLAKDLGSVDLEAYAVGFMRAAQAHVRSGDKAGAVLLAETAAELSPRLSAAHFVLASTRYAQGPSQWGKALGDARRGIVRSLTDVRQGRLVLADLSVAWILAVLGTALVVSLALFSRAARGGIHDLRHLLPKGTHPAVAAFLLLVLVLFPLSFRFGLWPVLCALFAVSTFYLSNSERAVQCVALCVVALIPLLAERVVLSTSFAGTLAEDLYRLDRSGPGSSASVRRGEGRVAEGKAGAEELLALGRFRLLHGDTKGAVELLEKATQQKSNDVRVLVNMGNALLASGNGEGALQTYKMAAEADSQNPDPLYNLGKLRLKRAALLPMERSVDESGEAYNLLRTALALEPGLEPSKDVLPTPEVPLKGMIGKGLTDAEFRILDIPVERSEAVRRQLAMFLFGKTDTSGILPIALALVLFGLGLGARAFGLSRACVKCGGPVCRRCHASLRQTSLECGECFLVLGHGSDVPVASQIRKQIEIAQQHQRTQRTRFLASILMAGGGHLLSGTPVRGALYVFGASFLGGCLLVQGMFRGPYGGVPTALWVVPTALLLLALSLLSLRDLRRRLEVS
jgi:tetratricopeptide (TPR) repeat protein